MMKNTSFMFVFVSVVALCGFQVEGVQAAGLPIPSTGKTYTVAQLLNLINMNNPNRTSTFLVAVNGTSVVMDRDSWSVTGGKITNMTGSKSIDMAGLKSIVQSNLNTSVTLKADNALITHLANSGVLDDTTRSKYSKILLYFTLNGYRFYLNDPNPGRIVRSAGVVRSPALNIINKWDFNKSF